LEEILGLQEAESGTGSLRRTRALDDSPGDWARFSLQRRREAWRSAILNSRRDNTIANSSSANLGPSELSVLVGTIGIDGTINYFN
jgi:hypothetical protein